MKSPKGFTPPLIYGELCEKAPHASPWLRQRLRATRNDVELLPFHVESRYLKNVVTCMHLMDIQGMLVHGCHQEGILQHLEQVDPPAMHAGRVDLLIRKRGAFLGINTIATACLSWLSDVCTTIPNYVVSCGESDDLSSIVGALCSKGAAHQKLNLKTQTGKSLWDAASRKAASPHALCLISGKLTLKEERTLHAILSDNPPVTAIIHAAPNQKSLARRDIPRLSLQRLHQRAKEICVDFLTQ